MNGSNNRTVIDNLKQERRSSTKISVPLGESFLSRSSCIYSNLHMRAASTAMSATMTCATEGFYYFGKGFFDFFRC